MRQRFYRSLVCVVFIVAAMTLLPMTRSAQANGPWYVAPDGEDTNDCASPTTSCATVNRVLDKPGFAPGDTILVATGTYTSTSEPPLLLDKDAVVLGGWDATFSTQEGSSYFWAQRGQRGIDVQGVTVTLRNIAARSSPWPESSSGATVAMFNNGNVRLENAYIHSSSFGVYNFGPLTITHSVIRGNNLQGISSRNTTLYIEDSSISNNGGRFSRGCTGLFNWGTATIVNSAIYDNRNLHREGGGGGLCNSGRMTLVNSTISGNAATYPGPNIKTGVMHERGGGIYNGSQGTLALYNTTVSDNTAVHGGGIFNDGGTVLLHNSIVAGNHVVSKPNYPATGADCLGIVTSRDYNLLGDPTDCSWHAGAGDLVGVAPVLFGLRFYDDEATSTPGPYLAYHPLSRTSPAINAGDLAGCAGPEGQPLPTDQRGVPRVGRCDIGAYEYSPEHDPLFYSFLPLLHRD